MLSPFTEPGLVLQAPSLLGASTPAGAQALEDADMVRKHSPLAYNLS